MNATSKVFPMPADRTGIHQTRERYESPADRDNQFEIATVLGARWDAVMHELPHSYEIDFVATRDNIIVAVVETKQRSHGFEMYPDVMVSLRKWKALKEYEAIGIRAILAFRFQQTIYWHRVADWSGPIAFRIGGRTVQTRDTADIEPVIHIPADQWKKL